MHGVGEVHDRQVNRAGAYAETCLAVERARSAGLSVGGNVFLTTASLAQLDELTTAVRRLPVNAALCFTVASFLPTPRSRRTSSCALALPDLLPHATGIAELTAPINRRWWASLEAHTEAAYVRQALADDWPAEPERPAGEVALVCRPDLGVYSGLAGPYRTRHGNVRADGAAAVLDRALACGLRAEDAVGSPTLTRFPARLSWPPAMAMPPGWESTRARSRCAICGLIAPGGGPGNTGPRRRPEGLPGGHAAHDRGLGRPQRCWRSLRTRARSRRWAVKTPGWRALALPQRRQSWSLRAGAGWFGWCEPPRRKVRTGPNCAFVMSLGDAAELARRHAARAFGAGSA